MTDDRLPRSEARTPGDPDPVARARSAALTPTHRRTLDAVLDAAATVTESWNGEATTDRTAVVDPLRRALVAGEVDEALLVLLVDAVAATGFDLCATPVPAPPYLVVTGEGPVLRGTVADGRFVLTVGVFAVERTDAGPRYVRADTDPETALDVAFRPDR